MDIRIETIAEGILRIRRSEQFGESLLERYGIIHAQPTGEAGFEADEHGIRLPGGRTIPIDIWQNPQDEAWRGRVAAARAHFAEHSKAKRVIIGDPNGNRQLTADNEDTLPRTPFGISFGIKPGERFYGLGEGNRDKLNLRGGIYQNWVFYTFDEAPVPFLMSSEGWGMLINNDWKHFVDVGREREDRLCVFGERGEMDVFIFYGGSMPAVLQKYAHLTGHAMVLPKWAYGLTYIAPIYADEFRVTTEARIFREKHIPCDMISLEPGWMTKFYDHGTDKQWELTRFHMPAWRRRPHPFSFVTALKRYGFKLKLWLCVDYDLSAEEERLVKNEATCEPEAWFNHLCPFVEDGVDAFKLDPCELVYETHPGLKYANGLTDEQMHNVNQTLLGKQMYQGFARKTNRRPMHHYCGAYTGMQKWSAFTTGDNGGRQGALTWLLNMAMTGFMNTSCDMDVTGAESIHFGLLLPWGHLNSWYGYSQPWWAGDDLEKMFTEYARLRYRLIPYLYSAALEGHEDDMPMMRPLPLAYPEDAAGWNCVTQYMLGPWLMVTAFDKTVHLPEGTWEDFWTGERWQGPRDIEYTVPEGRGGGLFVRRGAIIPQWKDRDYVYQYSDEEIELHIYPCGESEYLFREDDGLSLDYENAVSCHTRIRCRETEQGVRVTIGKRVGDYTGKVEKRRWKLVIHGTAKPVSVEMESDTDEYVTETVSQ